MDTMNLGQFLARDRIESSPFVLAMKKDVYCEQLCVSDLGPAEQDGVPPNEVAKAIRQNYHNNWIVDGLPAAKKISFDEDFIAEIRDRYGDEFADLLTNSSVYGEGSPAGFVPYDDSAPFLYNHVNIEIMYHPVEMETDQYRIVRFSVEPFSIKHDFELAEDDGGKTSDGSMVVELVDPIPSCDPKRKTKVHTNSNGNPQLASGKVLFTYDVIWVESPELKWASRWDIYVSMNNAFPAKVHWTMIAGSLALALFVSAPTAVVGGVASFKQWAAKNGRPAELDAWKSLHSDVFRPPHFSPLLLSVACGTGAQILFTSMLTIVFATMGFLGPANRGALLMAELFLFGMMGVVAGYVTARMYKLFTGKPCQKATMYTALGFPGIAFTVFFVLDRMASAHGGADALPLVTILILMVLWFGTSTPLVFLGAYLGYEQDAVKFPVSTSSTPRQIPDQPWYAGIPVILASQGFYPVCFFTFELNTILSSVWTGQFYTFGFLLVVYSLFIAACAVITVRACYLQLCREDYRWWWSSFCTAGSSALYVFFYSIVYYFVWYLEANSVMDCAYYTGYMGIWCFGLFLMTGFIGVVSSLWFNKIMFSPITIGGKAGIDHEVESLNKLDMECQDEL